MKRNVANLTRNCKNERLTENSLVPLGIPFVVAECLDWLLHGCFDWIFKRVFGCDSLKKAIFGGKKNSHYFLFNLNGIFINI